MSVAYFVIGGCDTSQGRRRLTHNEKGARVTEDELADLLNELEQGLIDTDLSILVDQERIAATEGKAEEPTVEDIEGVRQEWALRGLKRPSRPRADDVRIRPLDLTERLAQLLDLLEVAIGGSYAIETHLRDDLRAALEESPDQEFTPQDWNGQIVFALPADSSFVVSGRTEWSLPDQKTLEQREAPVRRVILLINQLRNEIGIHRSDYLELATDAGLADFDPEFPGGWS
jgi:hypothetical protein